VTEAAFLAAIIERPDDDVPRLVFADWLDEHGQPERAEFIRVQVELAALPDCPACGNSGVSQETVTRWIGGLGECGVGSRPAPCWKCPRHALRRRERELWRIAFKHQAEWLGLPFEATLRIEDAPGLGPYPSALLCRGFVSAVTLSWADWSRHAAALLAACPIRRVNRPRACERCLGGGRIYHGADGLPDVLCRTCRGTGRVDVWRGDGLVRLTTWPDDRWLIRQGFGRLAGDLPTDRLLAAEFPGVRFELPAAGVWDAPARSTPLADIRALQNRVRSLGRPVVPHLPDREAVRLIAAAHGRPDPFTADTPEARP
jgi:uncharacterized protein (TIGR02996 family)